MIRFDKLTNTFWLPRGDQAVEAMLDIQYERIPGELRWKHRGGFIEKAKQVVQFVQTVTSGQAPPEEVERRKRACFGPPEKCPALIQEADGAYCAGCKCGRWKLADLTGGAMPKLAWASLACPLRRF